MSTLKSRVLPCLVVAAALQAGDASATDILRTVSANAANQCQSTVPSGGSTLRVRPLGIVNEGTTAQFVTCSFEGGAVTSSRRHTRIVARFSNPGGVPRTASCTLVDGYQGRIGNSYVVRSGNVNPSGGVRDLEWLSNQAPDFQPYIRWPNLSCELQPGVSLDFVEAVYREDIGV